MRWEKPNSAINSAGQQGRARSALFYNSFSRRTQQARHELKTGRLRDQRGLLVVVVPFHRARRLGAAFSVKSFSRLSPLYGVKNESSLRRRRKRKKERKKERKGGKCVQFGKFTRELNSGRGERGPRHLARCLPMPNRSRFLPPALSALLRPSALPLPNAFYTLRPSSQPRRSFLPSEAALGSAQTKRSGRCSSKKKVSAPPSVRP